MFLGGRANVVCHNCHSRKVKCDLQSSPDGVCKNCRRSHQPCIRRDGVRQRRGKRKPLESNAQESNAHHLSPVSPQTEQQGSGGSTPRSQHNVFINRCSHAYYGQDAITSAFMGNSSTNDRSDRREALIKSTHTRNSPSPVVFRAWADAYMKQTFHHCPVVEQKDLYASISSPILQKGICLIGNLMRHDPRGPQIAQDLYEELKLLISFHDGQDMMQTLKGVCLISFWSIRATSPVSLDTPLHWTGVGARLALRMGLHRESTYLNHPEAKCLRRLFWQLHNDDTLQVACWNHPPILGSQHFDVNLPTLADFENPNVQSLVFIETTKLCIIISRISKLHAKKRPLQQEEIDNLDASLCDWIHNLPPDLQLYDSNGERKLYCRPVSEMSINYLVAVFMSQLVRYRDKGGPRRVSASSLLAASCAASLYEEINSRDEAQFLPTSNNYSCLLLALPLIYHKPQSPLKEAARIRHVATLLSVLRAMKERCGDAGAGILMIEGFENSVSRGSATQNPGGENARESRILTEQLFPFPATMCENMDLLDQAVTPTNEIIIEDFLPTENWPTDDFTLGYNVLDMFGLDSAYTNIE